PALLEWEDATEATEDDSELEDGVLEEITVELATLDTVIELEILDAALELAPPAALYTSNSAMAGTALASTYKLSFFMLTVPKLIMRFPPMAVPLANTSFVS